MIKINELGIKSIKLNLNEIYSYVLRCVILAANSDEKLNNKNKRQSQILLDSTPVQLQTNSKQNDKLLEALIKSLKKHLNEPKKSNIIMSFSQMDTSSNQLFKEALKKFQGYLQGNSTKELAQKIGNIEGLIMLFTKYSKNIEVSTMEKSNDPITIFANMLKLILNTEFFSHAAYQPTLNRLNLFLQPNKEMNLIPTGNDGDIFSKLTQLFEMDQQEHTKLYKAYKPHVNEMAALQDLKKCLTHLELQLPPYLNSNDYPDTTSYQKFKNSERTTLNQLLVSLSISNPNLLSSSQESAGLSISEHQERNFLFIPKEPREAYRLLLLLCFRSELINRETPKPKPNHGLGLPEFTQTILKECALRWRLGSNVKTLAQLEACIWFYSLGLLSFDYVVESMNLLHKHLSLNPLNEWAKLDLEYYYLIDEFIVKLFLKELLDGLKDLDHFNIEIGKLKIAHLENSLNSKLFEQFNFQKDPFINEIQHSVQTIFAKRYEEHNDLVEPEAGESEAQNLKLMAKLIMADIRKVSKIFDNLFLGKIEVGKIVIEQEIKFFILQVENMANGKESDSIPVEEAFDFYNTSLELYDRIKLIHPEFRLNLNLVRWFNRQFSKWLAALDDKAGGWVELAIKYDEFREVSEQALHSSSVDDLLQCFREQLDFVHKLIWPNDLLESRSMAKVAKVIYEGVAIYANEMGTLFNEEMSEHFPMSDTSGSQWSLLSRRISLSQTPKKQEKKDQLKEGVHEFSKKMCIIINNLYQLRKRIQELFSNLDYPRYSRVLAEYHQQREDAGPSMTMFYIHIVMAEFLKECDVGKDNDAYAVLHLKGEKIFTTSIQWDSAIPRWDETVGISLEEKQQLKVEVYDKDYIKDDLCGEGYLNLDPHGDWSSEDKDIWVDLQPQGRILLSISTADEKDDPQYYVSKALKLLEMKERDLLQQMLEKLNVSIKDQLSRTNLLKPLYSKKQSLFGRLLNRTQPTQAEFTEEECDAALWDLCNFLDAKLNLPYTYLYNQNGMKLIRNVWKECILTLEASIVPSFSTHRAMPKPLAKTDLEFCMMAVELLKIYFHGGEDEDGLPLKLLEIPEYFMLQMVQKMYHFSTQALIKEYLDAYKKSAQQPIIKENNQHLDLSSPTSPHPNLNSNGLNNHLNNERVKSFFNNSRTNAKEKLLDSYQADLILRLIRMRGDKEGIQFVNSQLELRLKQMQWAFKE